MPPDNDEPIAGTKHPPPAPPSHRAPAPPPPPAKSPHPHLGHKPPPPHKKHHPPLAKRPSGRHHAAPADVARFVDAAAVETLLAPFVAGAEDRAFVRRCVVEEGPAHHRGANFVLLRLLSLVEERLAAAGAEPPPEAAPGAGIPIPLRLPPHLEEEVSERSFPIALPTGPLELLAPRGAADFDAMVDCLCDGPPQHALANAAMVALIERLLAAAGSLAPRAATA